jgi:NDP-sugar pyrophosphorylase family protein
MKALILIGGEGTRLRPITTNTLKCIVPIANKPFIEYQINLLKKYGIKDIILSVCCMPEKAKKAIGNGKKYGVRFKYAGELRPLGTGGAIKNCEALLDDTTIVMNGDILTDINMDSMIKTHRTSKALVTLALHEVDDPSSYGLVETGAKGEVLKFTEKPAGFERKSGWINAGMYVLARQALDYIPTGRNVSIEREIFPSIISSGKLMQAYKGGYYWLDIGRIEKYMEANFDVIEGKFSGVKAKARGKKCRIGKSIIDNRSVLGNSVTIGSGALIENSVILDNTVIKSGAIIKNSVICRGCVINENCTVINTALGDNSILTKYTKYGV